MDNICHVLVHISLTVNVKQLITQSESTLEHTNHSTNHFTLFRRLLSSFEERIENMEDSIFLLKDNKSRTCSAVHSDPMTVSDLKFSKIKTLPLQRRKKRSHLHAGSLKHVSNSERTRALRSKTDQSLMSDNDSFLDGHSISCSLELMSDNVESKQYTKILRSLSSAI